ncbi:hypothetical protein QJS04_geneDACA011598 [Acorus gramineus]|uniref:Uncharacterized protein n=1 Tax=Acorus gramineus TaxID=55184 RepID=A0AAV8ZZE0_ACOGR|nr:hypothetical protein QJS04_geneDACA011598 [Acorus gramineus]
MTGTSTATICASIRLLLGGPFTLHLHHGRRTRTNLPRSIAASGVQAAAAASGRTRGGHLSGVGEGCVERRRRAVEGQRLQGGREGERVISGASVGERQIACASDPVGRERGREVGEVVVEGGVGGGGGEEVVAGHMVENDEGFVEAGGDRAKEETLIPFIL